MGADSFHHLELSGIDTATVVAVLDSVEKSGKNPKGYQGKEQLMTSKVFLEFVKGFSAKVNTLGLYCYDDLMWLSTQFSNAVFDHVESYYDNVTTTSYCNGHGHGYDAEDYIEFLLSKLIVDDLSLYREYLATKNNQHYACEDDLDASDNNYLEHLGFIGPRTTKVSEGQEEKEREKE